MPHKNVVTWTSMISSYVQHGSFQLALDLFKEMLASNEMPNHYTLFVVVRACTVVGYVDLGIQIHDAGKICEAEKLFRTIDEKDIVAWNAMITATLACA
ncbi:hypothetical protein RJ640_027674 [Escallonia rubra]|uniref:Pentatricopeptide repeat-containing protein n=1 Tax=Escallonia rubra TaxID=112253 RepID=A0AA88UTH9_9ASTE|nr:hypothetical protein RJ640_027674 [Escallonia rubra]